MRTIDFESIEESKSKARLDPGAYVCRVLSMEDKADRQYVACVWDVAEGPSAGHYSDQWGEEHPNAHRLVMSYKDSALSMLKGMLGAFTASNPGFDAMAAWNAGRLDMFTNRLIGLNLREEEYEYNGEVRTRLVAGSWHPVADVRAGAVRPMGCKKLQVSNDLQHSSNSEHVIELD